MGDRLISHPAAGLTLIELMIVIAMLATLSVGAVLALRPTQTDGDQAVLTSLWDRQRILAITGHTRRGLALTPRDVQSLYWTDGAWEPVGPLRQWRSGAVVSTPVIPRPGQPQVVFLPDGRSSAFDIRWSGAGHCLSTGGMALSCEN